MRSVICFFSFHNTGDDQSATCITSRPEVIDNDFLLYFWYLRMQVVVKPVVLLPLVIGCTFDT